MRILLILLSLQFLIVSVGWSDPIPPPPPSFPDGADAMPPSVDQPAGKASNAGLASPPADALKALDKAQATPSASDKKAPADDSLDTVAPPPPPQAPDEKEAPKAKPTSTNVPAPAPTMEQEAPLKNMTLSTGAAHAVADNGTQGGGTLDDYFPATKGMKWTYEYLGSGAKTREVHCNEQNTMSNGTSRVVLEVTEGDRQYRERYSLYGSKVEHTATADKLFKDHFVFKLPDTGETTHWSQSSRGMIEEFKASFGAGKARAKTYPDCLVVVERARKGKKTGPIVISYYAKGIGLVEMETYGSDMKLVPEKSFALSSSSAESSE